MATYQFATPDGKIKTVEASSPQEAQSKIAALGAAPRSGVALATGQGMGATTESGRRNLELASGNPASSLLQTGAAASQVQQTADPYARFNEGIMQLLTRHQAMGTKRFQEQEYNAQEAQNNRVLEKTPKDLIGAAPGVQNSVRGASADALDPTINQARNAQQTFSEQLRSYGDAVESARSLVASQQARADKERDDARAVIKDALTLGGADSLNSLAPEELKQLEKLAGYPAGYVQGLAETIKERELALKSTNLQNIDLGDRVGWFDSSGNLVRETPKAQDASLTASQKTRVDTLNTVMTSLDSYRALYDRLVGASGGNLTGNDAGELAGAYNTLLFQIAQAAGTGALQAADREVVENMIPNPTSIRGAIGGFIKGGKSGGLNAIDQARALFQNNLNAIQSNTTGGIERKTINGVEYEKVEGGWQKVSFNNGGAGTNRPQRNNNYLNIKASATTLKYPGVVGVDPVPATDGGRFLVFATPQDSLNAARRLITSSGYANLSVDAALKRWSGGGYGVEIAPSLRGKTISSLTPTELSNLINVMARREGAFA